MTKEVEISIMCISIHDHNMVSGYVTHVPVDEVRDAIMDFVVKMIDDGWIPVEITIDGKVAVMVGVITPPAPTSVN